MKPRILLLVLFALTASLSFAQDNAGRVPAKMKKITISGRVVSEGAGIAEEGDKIWTITNAEMLRAYAGARVMVKGLLNPATGLIQGLSVKPASTPVTTAARIGDSAFRR